MNIFQKAFWVLAAGVLLLVHEVEKLAFVVAIFVVLAVTYPGRGK